MLNNVFYPRIRQRIMLQFGRFLKLGGQKMKKLLLLMLAMLLLSACTTDPDEISRETMMEHKHYVKIDNHVYHLSENFDDFPIWVDAKLTSETKTKEEYKGRNNGQIYIKAIESMGWKLQEDIKRTVPKGTVDAFKKDGRLVFLYQYPDEMKFVITEE